MRSTRLKALSFARTAPAAGLLAALLWATPAALQADQWSQWRGPDGSGQLSSAEPPLTWGDDRNVKWKVEIPGKGHATPVVWKDRIYLTTSVPTKKVVEEEPQEEDGRNWTLTPTRVQRFVVLALDRATGKVVWEATALEELPHEGTHLDGTWASASPATDGEHLIAHFGSRGIYCYTLDGKLVWSKDLGDMRTRNGFGEGSSPVLHGDLVVINWDHEDESFIVALDKATGEERWRRQRDEPTSWSTPLVVEVDGKPQVVVAATGKTVGYDLATGATVWEHPGMTLNVIPSPVHADGVVYVMSGFRGNALQAIRLAGARGDLSGSDRIVWTHDRDTPYVPSPLLADGILYFLKHNRAILSAFDAASGEALYGPTRLDGIDGVYASPVGAAGRLYVIGRNGVSVVLAQGKEPKVLATNELDDRFDASPVVVEDGLLLRGHAHLYYLAESGEAASEGGAKKAEETASGER